MVVVDYWGCLVVVVDLVDLYGKASHKQYLEQEPGLPPLQPVRL